MDTYRPKEAQTASHARFHDSTVPLEIAMELKISVCHTPSTGLSMTGTIGGAAHWYSEDQLQGQGLDWFSDSIAIDLMEIIYLYLTRVYDVARSDDQFNQFFEIVFQEDIRPSIDFETETVSLAISAYQCMAVLHAIGADDDSYDAARAAHPAFPPV